MRRANFRARFYITIDGQPANALPRDENGAMLILTSAVKSDDYIATEPVARNLTPGVHTAQIIASRGWDQWALNGFSVGYQPPDVVSLGDMGFGGNGRSLTHTGYTNKQAGKLARLVPQPAAAVCGVEHELAVGGNGRNRHTRLPGGLVHLG
ncbi:MAG: hypothetical protein H6652_06365 [Ardenticatenaceae bacterium]|nr:hypothetical protein [Ardenticatenaceae bacterium]